MLPRTRRLRLLVPVDFSPTSLRALDHAGDWAAHLPCELHVLHVVEAGNGNVIGASAALPRALARLEHRVAAKLAHRIGAGGDPLLIRHHLSPGNARDEIARLARHLDADLIVMGGRGHGATGVLLGTVAQQVLLDAPCPVAIVPADAQREELAKVLSAVDFSEESRAAMRFAADLAERLRLGLVVFHATPPSTLPETRAREEALLSSWQFEAQARAHRPVATVFATGHPASEIVAAATRLGCGLVIMGRTHGDRSAVGREVAGTSLVPVISVGSPTA